MKYVLRCSVVLLFLTCAMFISGCGGGDISGDGMDTGSFLTVEIAAPLNVDACENTNLFAEVAFDNSDLPVPGTDGDETGIVHTSRHITIDRYIIEYIPLDAISPPLSLREYFQTFQLPPNSSNLFTDVQFLDVETKQEFLSFTANNPGITTSTYSVIYRFYGHNDLGTEVSAVATGSFHMFDTCP